MSLILLIQDQVHDIIWTIVYNYNFFIMNHWCSNLWLEALNDLFIRHSILKN